MSVKLNRGTIESVQITVIDNSQNITSLAASSPVFDVYRSDGTTVVVAGASASAVGMVIYCLLNTTGWTALETHFLLFVHFTVGSETPRLGPFDIQLIG